MYLSYLKKIYKEKIIWDFYYFYNFKSLFLIPFISKIILNSNFGVFFNDKKKIQLYISDLLLISNQKPFILKSKKSISNFKIRKGNFSGVKVTLRNNSMYNFLYKLISFIIPKINEYNNNNNFKISNFDFFGNYNFGIKDQFIFSEINYFSDFIKGMNINIIIKNNDIIKSRIRNSLYLLKKFKFFIF